MTGTATTGAGARTYTATVTGAQVYSLGGLVPRLNQADSLAAGRLLHQDLSDGLFAFLRLAPEPADADLVAYCGALELGMVPNWGIDDTGFSDTPAGWTAAARAGRASGPRSWPGLAPAGAARCGMPLTAAEILSFEGLAARLARRDGGALVVRHSLWAGLQSFADLLPQPSFDDTARYIAAGDDGVLPDWNAVPLTETAGERSARVAARAAAAASETAG